MIYVPKDGARFGRHDAQVLGEQIERMAQNGPVNAEDLVEAARPTGSAVHDYFEWDDDLAAEAYRKTQAHYYLRNIEVIREPEQEPIKAFHAVDVCLSEQVTQHGYVPILRVMQERPLAEQVIADERRRLIGCQTRLAQYREMIPSAIMALQTAIQEMVVA